MVGLSAEVVCGWRVGITQRRLPATASSFARDALDADWCEWFAQHWPGLPFVAIPNFGSAADALKFVDSWGVNFLLLSGGEDPGASPDRDAVEMALIHHAQQRRWPVLGVCRGMQILQLWSGGEIHAQAGHLAETHAVTMAGAVYTVNSWHQYVLGPLSADWLALAVADDGSVEVMRHRELPWLALMWHPERAGGCPQPMCSWIQALLQSSIPREPI